MAAERRFAALTQIRRRSEGEGDTPRETTAPVPVTSPLPVPYVSPKPPGRPPGKRSDPAWKQFSVLLRRDTQREAMLLLRRGEGGQDLSGLVQTLLAEWVRAQRGEEA